MKRMAHCVRGGDMGRRGLLGFAAAAAVAAGLVLSMSPTLAQPQSKIKIGLMLPYTGTYAALGTAITNGFKLAVEENGGKLGGREVEYFTVDDESDPAAARSSSSDRKSVV